MTSSLVAATTFAALFAASTFAQSTYQSGISCSYAQWSLNTLGQTPCDIWGQLSNLCGAANVNALSPASAPYPAPSGSTVNDCQCNSVAYNLMAACTWCQPGLFVQNWLTQTEWGDDCSNYEPNGIQGNIDIRNVTIPSWAFAAIDGSTWNPVDAEFANTGVDYPNLQGSETEEDGFTSYTYYVPTSGPFSSGGGNSNTSRSGSSGLNIVAIAVGVGVGVVVLLVLLIGCCCWRRRSNRKKALQAPPSNSYPPSPVSQQRPPSMQQYPGTPRGAHHTLPNEYASPGGYSPPPGPPGAAYAPSSRPGSYVAPR